MVDFKKYLKNDNYLDLSGNYFLFPKLWDQNFNHLDDFIKYHPNITKLNLNSLHINDNQAQI